MNTPIRRLRADEVELRAAQCGMTRTNKPYETLLIYKDARVDQRILDETFGLMNWERQHEVIDGRLYCTVRIWDAEKGRWVSKQDVGTESNTEKEKGQASDSFKRACFNWGIGRELYTAPKIVLYLNEGEYYTKEIKGEVKVQMTTSFYVNRIEYDDDGNICGLEVRDKQGQVRFTFPKTR
jgi:hypothetical protein